MMGVKKNLIYDFCVESNRIERKFSEIEHTQMETKLRSLLDEPELTEDLIVDFAKMCGGEYRVKNGMDVVIANHRPMIGGITIKNELQKIIKRANEGDDPFDVHCDFEILHPFMDGNGRTGRAIWVWQMWNQKDYYLDIGFLHLFYYQTLDKIRTIND